MRTPPGLLSLLEDGLIEAVLRPLQSGKEAQVYLVRARGEVCVAKIYKQANDRNFKNRSVYQEGRGTRNTRDQRAMKRRSSYGRSRDEDAWQSTEVEMIHRLRHAGVRVPEPYLFSDGVLVMELVQGGGGEPAPRLGDLRVSADEAVAIHDALLRDVVRMLCAGVVHGDLSEFNVLVDDEGPVIIDLPQAVDASSNQNAKKLLARDVENLQRFVTRWVPGRKRANFALEMWALYEINELKPDTELTGVHEGSKNKADTDALLGLIADVEEDETMRRLDRGLKPLATGTGELRVYINKDAKPARKKKARKPAPARKAKPKSKPQETAKPASKARSKDELVAQAIAARKAAAEAPAPSREATSEPERNRTRKRRSRKGSGAGTGRRADRAAPETRQDRKARPAEGQSERPQRPAKTGEQPDGKRRRRPKSGSPAAGSAGETARPERSRRSDQPKPKDGEPRRSEPADGSAPKRRRRRRRKGPAR